MRLASSSTRLTRRLTSPTLLSRIKRLPVFCGQKAKRIEGVSLPNRGLDVKKFISVGIGLFALATAREPASAADIPVYKAPPVTVWTWDGWYGGGNVGYSWGRWDSTSLSNDSFPVTPGPPTVLPLNASTAAGATTNRVDPDVNGWVGGVHAGRNWQFQNFVVGLEGDFSWSGERRSRDGSQVFTLFTVNSTLTLVEAELNTWKLDWFSTIRGRLGWAHDSWLVYGTGGAAVGRAKYDHTTISTATLTNAQTSTSATVTTALSESETKWGYSAGGGIEKAFSPNWIGRVEYLYIDLGHHTFLQNTDFETRVRLHDNIVRGGISYLFNAGPVAARY